MTLPDKRIAAIPNMGLIRSEQNAMPQLCSARRPSFGSSEVTGKMKKEACEGVYVDR